MLTLSTIGLPDPGCRALPDLTAADVADLQRRRGYPLISILAATTPGSVLSKSDQLRIGALLRRAGDRLRHDVGDDAARTLTAAARRLVVDAIDEPMGHGLAVFVGDDVERIFRLPIAPRDRVVVDPTFATRDLALASSEHAPVRLLLADRRTARLYLAEGGVCTEVVTAFFPITSFPDDEAIAETIHAALRSDSSTRDYPLVIFGPPDVSAPLRELTGGGTAPLERDVSVELHDHEIHELMLLARPHLEAVRRRAQRLALDAIDEATICRSAAIGIHDVWRCALRGSIELLLVDRTFSCAARPGGVGDHLVVVSDPELPGVLDDAVDEVIEMTVCGGGSVVFLEPGQLGDDGIAAVVR